MLPNGPLSRAMLLCVTLVAALSPDVIASPTMVRLGYARCDACHLAPQGAGLLTDYGKGIDEAQSWTRGEYRRPERTGRLRYDLRLLTSGWLTTPADSGNRPASPSWVRGYVRSSVKTGPHGRIGSTLMVEAPPGGVNRLGDSKPLVDVAATWEVRPSKAWTLAVSRDRLPRGVELGLTRTVLDESGDPDRLPTQLTAHFTSKRLQFTTYGYGPGSSSAMSRLSRGIGALGSVQLFNNHLVIGSSVRASSSDLEDHWRIGGFTRLGTSGWGVLAEHELVHRTRSVDPAAPEQRYAGYTQFFAAPREWLVVSIVGEQVAESDPAGKRTFRWRPEVQARVSSHVTVTASVRNDVIVGSPGVSRIYLLQFALKTVQ
jgi:hypothetical protein